MAATPLRAAVGTVPWAERFSPHTTTTLGGTGVGTLNNTDSEPPQSP